MSLCEITSGSLLKDHPEELFGGVAGVGAEKISIKIGDAKIITILGTLENL